MTLHDIMEEVAGELPDRSEISEIVQLRPGAWRIEGEAILTDISRVTGFTVSPSDHYQTIAGFLLDLLQRLPEQGESVVLGTWKLEILRASSTSIEAVALTRLGGAS